MCRPERSLAHMCQAHSPDTVERPAFRSVEQNRPYSGTSMTISPLHLRLPATSANLGPGFDALGLAMALYLTIDARVADSGAFHIDATGRDAVACSAVENNL